MFVAACSRTTYSQSGPVNQSATNDDLLQLRKAAISGGPRAQALLGQRYASGQGVPQSDSKAMEWIRKAAEQGYARA